MNSFVQFIIRNCIKTLPDGKRVFLNIGLLKSSYFLIPDSVTEGILRNKVFWTNAILLTLGISFFFIVGHYTDNNFYFIYLFLLFWQALSIFVAFSVIKKDITNLQKINIKYETTYFYDNFTNKVQVGKIKIPPDYEIAKYLDVSDSDDKILLLRYKDSFPIILRCVLGGWEVWQSEIKSKHNDIFINMEWNNGKLHISSGSVLSIFLNANTGSIVE